MQQIFSIFTIHVKYSLSKEKKKKREETSHIYSLRPVLSEMSQSRGESAADFDLHGSDFAAPRRCNTCLTFKKVGRHESLKDWRFEIRVASVCFFLAVTRFTRAALLILFTRRGMSLREATSAECYSFNLCFTLMHLLWFLMVFCSLGVSLNRPILSLYHVFLAYHPSLIPPPFFFFFFQHLSYLHLCRL